MLRSVDETQVRTDAPPIKTRSTHNRDTSGQHAYQSTLVPSFGFRLFITMPYKVKLKCTLVQALMLFTGRTPHRGSRGIALFFHDQRHYKGVRGQRHVPAALYPWERPGTHCTGGWVGPRAGLHRCGKSRPHQDSIPGPSSP
jgi:hypothetical protein